MVAGVYEIWVGPYFYQGSSKNIHRRIKEHQQALRNGKHRNEFMQRAYIKYGWGSWSTLVECAPDALSSWEQAFIDTNIDSRECLNLSRSADRCNIPYTDERRMKIAAKAIGRKVSAETRARQSAMRKGQRAWNKGVPHTPEALAKISAAARKPKSESMRKKLSATLQGHVLSDATKEKIRQRALERSARKFILNAFSQLIPPEVP